MAGRGASGAGSWTSRAGPATTAARGRRGVEGLHRVRGALAIPLPPPHRSLLRAAVSPPSGSEAHPCMPASRRTAAHALLARTWSPAPPLHTRARRLRPEGPCWPGARAQTQGWRLYHGAPRRVWTSCARAAPSRLKKCALSAAIGPIGRLGRWPAGPESAPFRPSDGAHGRAPRRARARCSATVPGTPARGRGGARGAGLTRVALCAQARRGGRDGAPRPRRARGRPRLATPTGRLWHAPSG